MKISNIFLYSLVQAGPIEQSDKTGISTAAFDEYAENIAKIGCGRGTIIVTKVWFLLWEPNNTIDCTV